MSQRIAISGYAGTGKSTIIEKISADYDICISKESAREVFDTARFFNFDDDNGYVFQKSIIDNEIAKIQMSYLNNLNYYVSDRSIIDNITYAQVNFGADSINYDQVVAHLQELCRIFKTDHLFNSTIYIKPCTDVNFVRNVILRDKMRQQTVTDDAIKFIDLSLEWDNEFFNNNKKINMISDEVITVTHFTENKNFKMDIDSILSEKLENRKM